MNATPCTQPLAANDARPARPVVFQTHGSAQAHALRLARAESPAERAERVEWVAGLGCYRAAEGGTAFEIGLDTCGGDFVIFALSPTEVARRQQAGIRAAIAEHEAEAVTWDERVAKSRMGSVQAEFRRYAAESRAAARSLELLLVLAVAS